MAEAATPKRPPWFWPAVAIVVVVLAAGGFAAPSILECSGSDDGFGTCLNSKLADLGLVPKPVEEPAPTSVAVAQPAEDVQVPLADMGPPDFGVRVEPNGSILIAGSGALGKTVEIYVNGELYGTADVDASGDWVLVPDAPLPPGGYELTLVDPDTGKPFEKSFVVAINEDLSSEPLVVASTPGAASEILQGLTAPAATTTVVAEADVPAEPVADAPVPDEPVAEEPAVDEPVAEEPAADKPDTAVAVAEGAAAEDAINAAATPPADAASLASEPPPVDVAATEPAAEPAVAIAEDVVGDVDALTQRIDALEAMAAPSIDAVEIDNGRNFFAGTGDDGATIRLYVDNVFVGDATVEAGRWLLETDDVLQNRSQRVRVDQLMPGTADVVARAEIDFIFEAPATAPATTAVAEAPVEVPLGDFGIDTDVPVPVEIAAEPEPEPVADTPAASADIVVAEAPVVEPQPAADASVTAESPAEPAPAADTASTATAGAAIADTATADTAPDEPAAAATANAASAGETGTSVAATATGAGSGSAVALPEPDFSVDTGIPVTVVAESPAVVAATPEPVVAATPEPAPPVEPVAETPVVEEPVVEEPVVEEPVVVAEAPPVEPDVPQLVATPMGAPELGRFATGKAIIRSGDNLWTIARRVYGSGYRYTQIYGANREQIRDPDLIYPGQVFDLPEVGPNMDTASN